MKKTCRPAWPKSGMRSSAPKSGAEVDEEEHDVGEDADGPGPDPPAHAEVGGGEPDEHADQLEPVQLVGADGDGGVDGLLEDVLRLVGESKSLHVVFVLGRSSCARTNSGVPPQLPRAVRDPTDDADDQADDGLFRAASHPDFHRRSRNFTRSTGRWMRSGRGLSPPARNYTDPGARNSQYAPRSRELPPRVHVMAATLEGCRMPLSRLSGIPSLGLGAGTRPGAQWACDLARARSSSTAAAASSAP